MTIIQTFEKNKSLLTL